MDTTNEELRSPNKDFSGQQIREHRITDSSGDESLTPSEESDFTTDITRRLSTPQSQCVRQLDAIYIQMIT